MGVLDDWKKKPTPTAMLESLRDTQDVSAELDVRDPGPIPNARPIVEKKICTTKNPGVRKRQEDRVATHWMKPRDAD